MKSYEFISIEVGYWIFIKLLARQKKRVFGYIDKLFCISFTHMYGEGKLICNSYFAMQTKCILESF